jgi:TetR/AcrR family transcriptional regulator, regulator of mycofactocin system
VANQADQLPAPAGRRRSTSRAELERVAFDLFEQQGFEHTTVDDVAAAAGISRRTFFRYFESKNEIPWGDFDGELARMRRRLVDTPARAPLMDAISDAIVDFNRMPAEQLPEHRRRMTFILGVPALQAHSTLRFAAWRQVIADFVAQRTGQLATDLLPRTIAHAMLGVAVAAYEHWLANPGEDLCELLDSAVRELASAFSPVPVNRGTSRQ